jgi:tetratricopeptide (TPR) repeat protein
MTSRTLRAASRWLLASALTLAGTAGCRKTTPAPCAAHHAASAPAPSARPLLADSAAALAQLDARLHALEALAAQRPDDWLDREFVAQGYLARARITGDYADYARAEDALDAAFRAAPAGSGPLLSRASFNYTMHRLDRVEPDLRAAERAILLTGGQQESIDSLRADTAFHSGRYEVARAGYERALQGERNVGNLISLAQYRWKTGDFAGAEQLLDEAATAARAGSSHGTQGFVEMVRGMMEADRGRWDAALAHYRAGLALSPDDWHLQDHEAETLLAQGHADQALPEYLALVARTNDPEFQADAAEIYLARGDHARAEPLVAQARATYEQRARRFPEAIAGHAIEFYLRFDPQRAVELAELNVRARPGGEAQVKLAQAYARVARWSDARRVVDAALATPWNTHELHAVASVVYAALGDTARAQTERQRAIELNPHAMESIAWLARPAAPGERTVARETQRRGERVRG